MGPAYKSGGILYTSQGVKRGVGAFVRVCTVERLSSRNLRWQSRHGRGEAGTVHPASTRCFCPLFSGFSEAVVFGKTPKAKGSPEVRFKGEGQKRDKLDPHLPAVRTGAMCTEKCRGCNGVRATQKRSDGVEAHPFGWGKHRVRLYAVRTRRGAAPAPPAPKGEKKCSTEERLPRRICAAVNKTGTHRIKNHLCQKVQL